MTVMQWLFIVSMLFGIRGECAKDAWISAMYHFGSIACLVLLAWEALK